MTYSRDLRERVVRYFHVSASHSVSLTAELFSVSPSTVRRWAAGFQPSAHRVRPKRDSAMSLVEALLGDDALLTYREIQARLLFEHALSISLGTLHTVLRSIRFSRKRVVARKIYGSLERIEAGREAFRAAFEEARFLDAISVDEVHFYSNADRTHGYSRCGRRILRHARAISKGNFSCVVAMDRNGILDLELVRDGAINGEIFLSFLRRLPCRRRAVIMDNIRFHHSRMVRALLEQRGSVAEYIPSYTPEYNPIEYAFSQVKSHYKTLRRCNREDDVEAAIRQAFEIVTPEHCANYFRFVSAEITGHTNRLDLRRPLVQIRRYVPT